MSIFTHTHSVRLISVQLSASAIYERLIRIEVSSGDRKVICRYHPDLQIVTIFSQNSDVYSLPHPPPFRSPQSNSYSATGLQSLDASDRGTKPLGLSPSGENGTENVLNDLSILLHYVHTPNHITRLANPDSCTNHSLPYFPQSGLTFQWLQRICGLPSSQVCTCSGCGRVGSALMSILCGERLCIFSPCPHEQSPARGVDETLRMLHVLAGDNA